MTARLGSTQVDRRMDRVGVVVRAPGRRLAVDALPARTRAVVVRRARMDVVDRPALIGTIMTMY
jgi:hypothetical protein